MGITEDKKRPTGASLYLALNNYIERIIFERRGELPLVMLPTSGAPAYCAYLPGIPDAPDSEMRSTAFTATEVARMAVRLGKAERIAFSGNGHGLGIRLQSELSPALALLVNQLNECVETVCLIESTSPGLLSALGGSSKIVFSSAETALCMGTA